MEKLDVLITSVNDLKREVGDVADRLLVLETLFKSPVDIKNVSMGIKDTCILVASLITVAVLPATALYYAMDDNVDKVSALVTTHIKDNNMHCVVTK